MAKARRVGAHRRPSKQRGRRRLVLLGALVATALLTAAGVAVLDIVRPSVQTPPVQTAAPPLEEVVTDPSQVDPALELTVTVLDASGAPGLAEGVGQALKNFGWDVAATGGATTDSATTIVWYDSDELAPAARGLAQVLTVGEVQKSQGRISGSPITIVLGADADGSVPSARPSDSPEIETGTPSP